jgi:hypothetical protein
VSSAQAQVLAINASAIRPSWLVAAGNFDVANVMLFSPGGIATFNWTVEGQ